MESFLTTELDPFTAVPDGARPRVLAELAAAGPLHRRVLPGGALAWVVTGYDEARTLLSDPRIVKGGPSHAAYAKERPVQSAGLHGHMASMDPPDHTRLRKLVSMAFTRRRVEELAPRVEAICAELLDALAIELQAGGTADLIAAFAYPLPMEVICGLLGIPAGDRPDFHTWCSVLIGGSMAGIDAYTEAADAMLAYLHRLLDDKRRAPAEDLLSALVQARDGADRLSEDELTSMVFLLILAGHETTASLISNGIRTLLAHPGQLALLRADAELLPRAIEEILRFDSPTQAPIPSIASERVEIAGQVISQGDIVLVSLLGANRDPGRFTDPDTFDIGRDGSHLGFGHGIHHCLGAPLARLEGQIAIGAVIQRFPDLELAVPFDELERVPSLLINRLTELKVRRRLQSV
jgi:cytochrome P450